MKRLLSAVVPMLICACAYATPVEHLFVPAGFDDNDTVEVLVSGSFPNECFDRNDVETKIHGDQIEVKITAIANKPVRPCDEPAVPFLETVTLGTLPSGTYQVLVNGSLKEILEVKEASSLRVDDHIYAAVEYVELGFTGGLGGEVILIGSAPDCLEFYRVETISNGKDTVSVLPQMKRVKETCSEATTRFQIPVTFEPEAFEHQQVLLFVRTMDGKSIYAVVEK